MHISKVTASRVQNGTIFKYYVIKVFTGLDDTSLDTTDGHCSNTADFVDVLEGETEGLACGTCGGNDSVEGLEEGGTLGISFLTGDFPSLVPSHVGGGFQHVVAMPSGNGDESDGLGIVADLLDEALDFLDDFIEPKMKFKR